jgi:hypothetical protein
MHFEIPANDPEKLIAFYSDLFGWKVEKWPGPVEYWLANTGDNSEPGINGGFLRRRDPAQPCVNTVGVPNIDQTIRQAEAKGGKCVVPKMPVPGVGWLAYCQDPEGNMIGIMQPDPAAK